MRNFVWRLCGFPLNNILIPFCQAKHLHVVRSQGYEASETTSAQLNVMRYYDIMLQIKERQVTFIRLQQKSDFQSDRPFRDVKLTFLFLLFLFISLFL